MEYIRLQQLIERVSDEFGISQKLSRHYVIKTMEMMQEIFAEEKTLLIRNFGSFVVKRRQNGVKYVRFNMGKALKDMLN